jgi:hypothetical protein
MASASMPAPSNLTSAARADSGVVKRPVTVSVCSGMAATYPPSAPRNPHGPTVSYMTELDLERRCRFCRRPLPAPARTGRPREFCRASCRQQEYVRRQRAHEVGLAEDELVVTRRELDELHDLLYVLEAAVEDVERDLAEATTMAELRDATQWVLDAARPLTRRRLGDAENPRSVK